MRENGGRWTCSALGRDLFNVYKYLKEGRCQEDGARLFAVVSSSRVRGNRQKLIHRKFHLDMWKNFTVQVTMHWNRFPREVVGSPLLEIFKHHVGTQSCAVYSGMILLEQRGWTR